MAATEILYFSVKSDIKDVIASQKEWNTNLQESDNQIKIQNKALIDMNAELVKLEKAQQEMGKGTWKDSLTGTTRKIEKQKLAIKGEKAALQMLKEQQKEATTQVKKFNKAADDQSKSLMSGIGNFKVLGVSLNGIKSSFGKIIPISKAMFASIKMGIASTGIGLLLLAFGALMTHLLSVQSGMDKVNVVIAKVSAAINVIKDRIADFGGAIIKVFSGDFKGAASDMKDSLAGIGDEMEREVKIAGELELSTQRLADMDNEFILLQAEKNKAIAEARLIATDETKSQEERVIALENAIALETELLDTQVSNQQERVRILEETQQLGKNTREDDKALAEERAKALELETTSLKKQRTLARQTNTLKRELAAEEQARLDEIAAANKARDEEIESARLQREADAKTAADEKKSADQALQDLEDENMLAGIEDLRERALAELEIQQRKEEESLAHHANFVQLKEQLDIKYGKAKEALEVKELKFSDLTAKQKIGMASDAFGQLSTILGKETKAGKAAAIAQATIQTYLGATSAFTSMSTIPVVGPALGVIAAGAAIAGGFKNIKAIRDGSNSPEDNMDMPDLSADSVDAAAEAPGAEMLSGAFSLGGGEEPDPVRAFVVTDDMTNSQDQLGDIRRTSTL